MSFNLISCGGNVNNFYFVVLQNEQSEDFKPFTGEGNSLKKRK